MEQSLTPGTWCPLLQTKCGGSCGHVQFCSAIFAIGKFIIANTYSTVNLKRIGPAILVEKTIRDRIQM